MVIGRETGLALRLASFRGHANPLEFRSNGLLAGGVGFLFRLQASLLLFQPGGVVALEGEATASIEFKDPLRCVIEEVAIVSDGYDGPLIILQEALQPGDRLGVEMVGRLVEQKEIWSRQQQTSQRNPTALTAGKVRNLGVAWWKA